ncbi:MAG: hypothetical protein HC772_18875 [Leptolyngbyaceae cyanobacterium CRU_2_3]|nr:hypothetical protein [Leptolyngbyaceae cyanobacterium CRU_2_3]
MREHLETHQAEYAAKLGKLRGKAEYLLKLIALPFPELAIAPDLKGKDYFSAKTSFVGCKQRGSSSSSPSCNRSLKQLTRPTQIGHAENLATALSGFIYWAIAFKSVCCMSIWQFGNDSLFTGN